MDEHVKELLDRVRDTAATVGEAAETTARCAGKYAGQMVDIAKLNMKIFDLKTDIGELLRNIGQVVYDAHLGRESDQNAVESMLKSLDEKHAGVEELKGRIAVLRNARECPGCGATCGRGDKFCKTCGKEL